MIDSGASLILGHGPHYPQGIENYRHGTIVYSLGNFIFDEPFKFAKRSFIYTVAITEEGKTTASTIHPVHLLDHVPTLVNGHQRERLERLVLSVKPTGPRTKPFGAASTVPI
jgi:poly-gamma-glutamate synthesis protein (capsule biosynthesis protein)